MTRPIETGMSAVLWKLSRGLRDAVFLNFEVLAFEVLNEVSTGIEDGDVEGDFFDFAAENEAAFLFGDGVGGSGWSCVGVGQANRIPLSPR